MNKKFKVCVAIMMVFIILSLTACTEKDEDTKVTNKEDEVPELTILWGIGLHHPLLDVTRDNLEHFKERGVYLEEISENKFNLIDDGKIVAKINRIEDESIDPAELMAQGHIDAGMESNTTVLLYADKGVDMKIISPMHTGAMGVVFDEKYDLNNWDEVKKFIEESDRPVKIGHHSHVNTPKLLLEHILKEEGFTITEDPLDTNADVFLVNLKGPDNLVPSIPGGHVDGWVGPSPRPERADSEGAGKLAMNIEGMPPEGSWVDTPCCVFAATDESLEKYPDVYESIIKLLTYGAEFTETHKDESLKSLAKVTGVDEETIKKANVKYSTEVTDGWTKGVKVFSDSFKENERYEGRFKDKEFDEIKKYIFDFELLNKVRNELSR